MTLRRVSMTILMTAALAAGCQGAPTVPTTPSDKGKKSSSPKPSPSVSASVAPSPTVSFGQVLGLDGKPAANVSVKGYLISNNGGSLIGNNGSSYQVLQAADVLDATTDAEGRFTLKGPEGATMNVEAVLNPTTKAIKLEVATSASGLTLQLAPTGGISGKVTAPSAPTITNFQGVDVYIPGTGYTAKTAADGSFTLTNVPVGSFKLVAEKVGMGQATATGVAVTSGQTASAPALALTPEKPTITAVTPTVAAAGSTLTVTGTKFGASGGLPVQVRIGGQVVASPVRTSDTSMTVTVPDNATGGEVVVEVNQVASAPSTFTLAKSLKLLTSARNLALGAQQSFRVEVKDAAGAVVASPPVEWKSDAAALTVDATGKVTAAAAGSAKLTATLGTLEEEAAIAVHDSPLVVDTLAGKTASLDDEGYMVPADPVDGLGTAAVFNVPQDLTVVSNGTIYVADQSSVRKVTPDGLVSTFVGSKTVGFLNGQGANAQFKAIQAIRSDAAGNLYVLDDCRLRKITPDGTVTTVAGAPPKVDGTGDFADGTGVAAKFDNPIGLAVKADGTAFIADTSNHRIRMVTPAGVVTTLAGGPSDLEGELEDRWADGVGTQARFLLPGYLTLDAAGDLVLGDLGNFCLRKITTSGAGAGTVTTIVGLAGGKYNEQTNSIDGFHQDGVGVDAGFTNIQGLAFGPGGALYVSDATRLRKVTVAARKVETVAGTDEDALLDGPAASARFSFATGLAFDAQGHLLMVDTGRLRQVWFKP